MKKTLFSLFILLALILFIHGCQKNSELLDPSNESSSKEEVLSFTYRNHSYSCKYLEENDSIYFSDASIEKLFNEISSKEGVASVFQNNGRIDFYDSQEEVLNLLEKGTLFQSPSETRSNIYSDTFLTSTRLDIYEHKDFGGGTLGWNNQVNIRKFDDYVTTLPKLNDKMSSFKFSGKFYLYQGEIPRDGYRGAFVTFWTEEGCQGNSFWYKIDKNLQVNNNSKIPKNFNDKISSLTVVWFK